jgi:DNA end-binding protein Ku
MTCQFKPTLPRKVEPVMLLLLMTTDLKAAGIYFEDIPDEKIPKDMLELASHIVETKSGHFEPEKFEDHYEDALKELLKKKQAGEKIEAPKERAPAKVINLMDALRRSVEAERGGSAKRQAPSAKARGGESERPKKKKSALVRKSAFDKPQTGRPFIGGGSDKYSSVSLNFR